MRLSQSRSLSLLALAGVIHAQPMVVDLKYKPRSHSQYGGDWEQLAAGLNRSSNLFGVDLDLAGNMASVAVEELEKLNPRLWAYFASVAFDGDQEVDVLIDTGSAGLGVPIVAPRTWSQEPFQSLDPVRAHAQLVECADPKCVGHCDRPDDKHFCGPHGGSCVHVDNKDLCSFFWKYGDGSSAAGVLLTSPVDLGGVKVESTFGGITAASDHFYEAPRGGGIMGLSFGDYALCDNEFSCFPPLLDDVVKQRGLEDRFAVCANYEQAKLILGGGDERLYEGALQRVPLIPPFAFYFVNINEVTLGEESLVPRGFLRKDKVVGLVDTGNSALFLPSDMFDNFKTVLQRSLWVAPHLFERERSIFNGYAMLISDDVVARMPDFTIHLDNDATITLTPKDYLMEFHPPELPVTLRALKVVRGQRFVIGQTVLSKLYVEFDRTNKMVGFAPSKPRCEP